MLSSPGFALAIIFSEIIPAAIFLYAAYWAFEIRKGLANPIYRNHALWQGCAIALTAAAPIITYSNNYEILAGIEIFYSAFFVIIFIFIDSTVKIARRSDPLLRSILNWKRVRILGWAGIGLAVFDNLYSIVNVSFSNSLVGSLFFALGLLIAFALGGLAITIGARRSKDMLLRGNLKWLGLALLFAVGTVSVSSIEGFMGVSEFATYYSYPALPSAVFYILMGYAFYRSSRSLAPVSHFSLEDAPKLDPPAP